MPITIPNGRTKGIKLIKNIIKYTKNMFFYAPSDPDWKLI